ncbi:MAG: winged helix-turn-helix domain-containing protein [Dehalococcoidia bacterium]
MAIVRAGSYARGCRRQGQGMNNRRSNLEVIADILRLGEAGKTEIMYSANMSYRQLQKYLDFMVESGFLEMKVVPNPGIKYKVTKKGQRLLHSIDPILEQLGFQA